MQSPITLNLLITLFRLKLCPSRFNDVLEHTHSQADMEDYLRHYERRILRDK